MGRLGLSMASSQVQPLRWLALAVLASMLVVDCADQSEVEALNEDAAKWEWVPEGANRHRRDAQKKIAQSTFQTLSEAAAGKTRAKDVTLEHQKEVVQENKIALKEAVKKQGDANGAVAAAQAAEALEKVSTENAAADDAAEVVEIKEQDSNNLKEAKEEQEAAKLQVETTQKQLDKSEKDKDKAEEAKISLEANADALVK